MAYVLPTPASLKAHWPAFSAVPDETVQFNIYRAARSVDETWMEGDYTTAIELLACHYLTLAGLGTGTDAQANAQGLAGFTSIRSGSLSLQRAATSASGGGEVPAQYSGSMYGQQFWWLMRQNRASAAIAAYPAAPAIPIPPGWPWPWPLV